ncbi:Uncharacterised protein [Serratia fonticola]|uniref:hypothetical protein n=1 Tax=Serratia fonticola TaxID=47917 RepID=UPI0021830487|nr:hypothetical protein [Serratia fonticola]CAI2065398.1 Uncharacterised protein [Serratia fonticola]
MSQLSNMVIEKPDVLTEYTEVICSTNIERLLTGRGTVLKQITVVMSQLQELEQLIHSIGGGELEDWAVQSRLCPSITYLS